MVDWKKELGVVLLIGLMSGLTHRLVRGVPDMPVRENAASCSAGVGNTPFILRWVDIADAQALDTALFLDARTQTAYELGHISRAISMPIDSGVLPVWASDFLAQQHAEDPARFWITYCDTDSDCASSTRLAGLIADAGFGEHVSVLRGGFPGWLGANAPAESGPCRLCPEESASSSVPDTSTPLSPPISPGQQ